MHVRRQCRRRTGGRIESERRSGDLSAETGRDQVEVRDDDGRGLRESRLRLKLDHRGALGPYGDDDRFAADGIAAQGSCVAPDTGEDHRCSIERARVWSLIPREIFVVGTERAAADGETAAARVEHGAHERDALEERAAVPCRRESHLAHLLGEVARRLHVVGRAGEAATHGIGGVGLEPGPEGALGHRVAEPLGTEVRAREEGEGEQQGGTQGNHRDPQDTEGGQTPDSAMSTTTGEPVALPRESTVNDGVGCRKPKWELRLGRLKMKRLRLESRRGGRYFSTLSKDG